MNRFPQLFCVMLLGLLLAAVAPDALAQLPTIEGLGLSSNRYDLDSTMLQGDSLFVVASYTAGLEWRVTGVGLNADSVDQVRLYFYGDPIPAGNPLADMLLLISRISVRVDTISQPPRVQFALKLPEVRIAHVRSMQVEMAVYGHDTAGTPGISDPRTSFLQVGGVPPVANRVDAGHAPYLQFDNSPQIQGLGLSRSPSGRQTLIVNGDSVYVIVSFYSAPEWGVAGLGLSRDSTLTVRFFLHPDSLPFRSPIGSRLGFVDPASVQFDTLSFPRTIRFAAQMNELVIDPYVNSVQLEMGLLVMDSTGARSISEFRNSFSQVGNVPAVRDSVDLQHATYLTFRDNRTFPPVIRLPQSGTTVGRQFPFIYDQPEPADTSRLWLTITNEDDGAHEATRTLYPHDRSMGEGKVLNLNGANLFNRAEIDTVYGPRSLTHLAQYRFTLSYQDIHRNPTAADTIRLLRVDLRTETPQFYEPRQGSAPTDPNDTTLLVLYNLPERADSVWLTFTMDSNSVVRDTLSPHILLLRPDGSPDLYGPGMVSFRLDGGNIGTNNRDVAASNRGSEDSLIAQCVYRVTLTYGDELDNDNVSVTNSNYVWPRDRTTLQPRVISPPPPPQPMQAFNNNIHVVFALPETPRAGSVHLRLGAVQAGRDPGSPHMVYVHAQAPGYVTLDLNGTNLAYSPQVDSVLGPGSPEQNNTLIDSVRYIFLVIYRDSLGNDSAQSQVITIQFDNSTRPARIQSPVSGDTLSQTSMPVLFNQPEEALPGSLRLVLTRISGDPDVGSPHTLYLSNTDSGDKRILLEPASLAATQGVDRLEGGEALVPRAVYQFSIVYSDTLGNPAARTDVNNLYYPSGSAVFASGGSVGTGGIAPHTFRNIVFRLNLRTQNGASVLRALRFTVQGSVAPADIYPPEVRLFSSVDTVFSEADDQPVENLDAWDGGQMIFDSFAVALGPEPVNLFVTLYHTEEANPAHTVYLSLAGPSAIDCGGDPVVAEHWPLGNRDVLLAVNLTNFETVQDTLFGALRVRWTVASEMDNAGFLLYRKAENEDSFTVAASWHSVPELVGRGTAPTATRYDYVDRGLTPGRRYLYRLAAESINFDRVEFDAEAEGIPRIPPSTFTLGDGYPNPFNQDVSFSYVVPVTADVQIFIYDLLGRQVRRLVKGYLAPAEYRATWDSRDDQGVLMPTGVYWVRMKAGTSYLKAKKLLLLR